MTQDDKKRQVAKAALKYIEPGSYVGIGTGSTVSFFIEALVSSKLCLEGTVASSEATSALLRKYRIAVADLNSVGELPVYIDGADEATKFLHLIKGGGGALTREKILATASKKFVCIVDDSKLVDILGNHPLPIEVIPIARGYVARQIVRLGGQPVLRTGFTTDNGNMILDVYNLAIMEPAKLEAEINNIPGVVGNGIFALRPADVLLVGTETGVQVLT